MLTDKDFNELGKRLYDLEADPPGKGWKRIAADIVPPPPGLRKQQPFAGRRWWKGLLIILPITLYLAWPKTKTKEVATYPGPGSSQGRAEIMASGEHNEGTPESGWAKDSTSSPTNLRATNNNAYDASGVRQTGIDLSTDKIAEAENHSTYPEDSPANEAERIPGTVQSRQVVRSPGHNAIATLDSGDILFLERASDGEQQPISDSIFRAENSNLMAMPREWDLVMNVQADTIYGGLLSRKVSDSTTREKVAYTRSGHAPKTSGAAESGDKPTRSSTWRLTAAIAPQFSHRAVSPVRNDEVLVTSVSANKHYPERAGLGIAIGAGRKIMRNFYLDGQLTYTHIRQTIDFMHTTGKIDTLIAVQNQDGHVRVVPVYEISAREQKSSLSSGGVRVTATQYFWIKGRRRFNISGGAGLNKTLSDKFEEKLNGIWTDSNHVSYKKVNAHFVLSAGYNVSFGSGWEIMFSPMLTCYGKTMNTYQQPFRQTHRSYGLNIMLSKSLR